MIDFGMIKAVKLVHEYIRRDEEGNVDSIQTALDHIDLDIKAGEFIAILGHNGSGKSTLLHMLGSSSIYLLHDLHLSSKMKPLLTVEWHSIFSFIFKKWYLWH